MFHVKHEGWTPEELSPTQRASLVLYEELLLSQAIPRGIVAASDSGQLRTRHILDSLRAVPHIPDDAQRIVEAIRRFLSPPLRACLKSLRGLCRMGI